MPSLGRIRVRMVLAALSCAACCASAAAAESNDGFSVEAYDALTRDLLLRIELIEMEQGSLSRELLTPLFELGKIYVQADQCQYAIPIIQRAVLLSQRLDGVMNAQQLPLHEPLLECFVARDMVRELERSQNQMILIQESAYGKDDVRILPALAHAAEWYEQAGLYDLGRQHYLRAIKIAEKAGGKQDVRAVLPLRGMARTYRLEAQYAESSWSRALDAAGRRALERAATIVRDSPDLDSALRIETLLDLGDWYQMSGEIRYAAKAYKEAWVAAAASNAATELDHPEPILYRARMGTALRRPPVDREKLRRYWVDFEFTVNRYGEVRDVVVTDSTAPKHLHANLAENLKASRYRPRFLDGEPVDTEGLQLRQGVWVEK